LSNVALFTSTAVRTDGVVTNAVCSTHISCLVAFVDVLRTGVAGQSRVKATGATDDVMATVAWALADVHAARSPITGLTGYKLEIEIHDFKI